VLRKRVLENDVNKLHELAVSIWGDRSGATAIEYSLLAAMIALGIIAAVMSVGQSLDNLYPRLAAYMSGEAEPE
jgi:pilus assembly protein Flp/PilA